MDHVVYLDAKSKEYDKIQRGVKTHLIRGGSGFKVPYKKVFEGDILYFITMGEGAIKSKAVVKSVYNSPSLEVEESIALVEEYKDSLRLSTTQVKKYAGKKHLVIIEITDFERLESMVIDKSGYKATDEWLPVGDVHNILMI